MTKDEKTIPVHVAIIPDGNRRWAKARGLHPSTKGHYIAASHEKTEALLNKAKSLGVKYLSIWGFSTENWKRSEKEKKEIFNLILDRIEKLSQDAEKNKICFRHIGRKDRLPKKLIQEMQKLEDKTKNYKELYVQLLLDYGGRDEVLRAVNKVLQSGKKQINENDFKDFLDTKDIPDPDLIIRTSGEKRISGLLPWQAAYSEFYFTDFFFPDFSPEEFEKAIQEFSKRKRRFGGN